MGLLRIDQEKCKQDGICVMECPRQIIDLEEGGYPVIAPENDPRCMVCGHCVAVCPHGALSHSGVALEDCPDLDKALRLDRDQAVQFLRTRRSIRVYKDKQVNKETLQGLIETARYAPTGSNSQTVQWTVISGREKLVELSALTVEWMRGLIADNPKSPQAEYFAPIVTGWEGGYDGILRTAPSLIVASAPKEAANGLIDLTIALTYLELAALPLGLGTCWAGLLQFGMLGSKEVMDKVGLPQGHTHHYPMMIGFPKLKYQRQPERKPPVIHWK